MVARLSRQIAFPPIARALREPNGLLAFGGDLSPARLLAAYRAGIFPWYGENDPILWWSPDPRMVLFPRELIVPRSLAKVLRNRQYEVRMDSAFEAVMRRCAAPRAGQPGTWITEEMIGGYCALHQLGWAHSIETWVDGELAGGLYGVAIGRMFFGESMFTRVPDASKIALVHLVRLLAAREVGMIDCQMHTDHLVRFGARPIPRADFSHRLEALIHYPVQPGRWSIGDEPSR